MKNYAAFILSIALLVGLGFGFSSCKEDEPPVPPKLSFAETSMTVDEGDGTIEVELVLDKPYSKDLNIEYELGGTASDQDAVGTAGADYEIDGRHGVVEIRSGQTSGVIEIDIYDDAAFEEDETIEISIVDINTSDVQLTEFDAMEITITNDDAKVVASFATATMTVNEADGQNFVFVPVQLDKPAPTDMVIEYSLLREDTKPDAMDSVSAWNTDPRQRRAWDYYINTQPNLVGKLQVPAGATSANIEIQVVSDFYFDEENIRIQLVESNSTTIGTNGLMTIAIEQEDGKVILLLWENAAYTDVDMDMMLWIGPDVQNLESVIALAAYAETQFKEESIVIPTVFSENVTEAGFGMSYIYYSGTASPLNFQVHFLDYIDGAFEPEASREVFDVTYTTANRNPWAEPNGTDPIVVQTFRISNGEYLELSGITVPTSGSRTKTYGMPDGLNKSRNNSYRTILRK
jgi:hypothetical protein